MSEVARIIAVASTRNGTFHTRTPKKLGAFSDPSKRLAMHVGSSDSRISSCGQITIREKELIWLCMPSTARSRSVRCYCEG